MNASAESENAKGRKGFFSISPMTFFLIMFVNLLVAICDSTQAEKPIESYGVALISD